jgi:predicted membrane protein
LSAIQPTAHLSTLKLTSKFTELEDNEAQYLLNSHDIFERSEYEKINAVNEIVNKIRESNTRSLSAILVNEKEESRFWSFSSWAAKIKASLITEVSVFILTICVIFLLCKYKSRIGGLQEILIHFAVGVQERRRRQNNVLTE